MLTSLTQEEKSTWTDWLLVVAVMKASSPATKSTAETIPLLSFAAAPIIPVWVTIPVKSVGSWGALASMPLMSIDCEGGAFQRKTDLMNPATPAQLEPGWATRMNVQ